jgi:hypothetical protein
LLPARRSDVGARLRAVALGATLVLYRQIPLATEASYARKSSPSRIYGKNENAVAYGNRGTVRADAGANAEGLADFNQALNLRADEASNYEGQARYDCCEIRRK